MTLPDGASRSYGVYPITTNGATENINIIPSANRLFFRLKN